MDEPVAGRTRRMASRPVVIGAVLAGAAVMVLAGGRPWVEQAVSGVPGTPRVSASGSQAAPAVTAVALVSAAGAVALALTGRLARRLIAGLLVLAGLGAVAFVVTVLRDPGTAISPALQAATGEIGGNVDPGGAVPGGGAGLTVPGGAAGLTAWPWLSLAAALTVTGAAAAALLIAGRWPGPARRFEVPAAGGPAGAGTSDPGTGRTSGGGSAGQAGRPAGQAGQAGRPAGQAGQAGRTEGQARTQRDRVLEDWDALSRGEDPTAG